jgi:hypothetical protein
MPSQRERVVIKANLGVVGGFFFLKSAFVFRNIHSDKDAVSVGPYLD